MDTSGEPPEESTADEETPLPRRPSTTIRVVAGILVIGLLGLYVLRPSSRGGGDPTGPFELVPVASGTTISSEDLRGRPVVLNFWASWCSPCRREMPLFQEAWEKYRDAGVLVIGVDVKDAPQSAIEFLEEIDVTYPVVKDEEEALLGALGITTGLPQTYFLEPDPDALDALLGGRAHEGGALVIGEITQAELNSRIEEMIEGTSA